MSDNSSPTREEIVSELDRIERSRGSGAAPFVDYQRLARAYLALHKKYDWLGDKMASIRSERGLLRKQVGQLREDLAFANLHRVDAEDQLHADRETLRGQLARIRRQRSSAR